MNNWPEKFWMGNGKIFYEGGKPSDAYIFVEEDSDGIAVYYHRTTEDEVLAFMDGEDNFTIVEEY